MKYGNKDAIAAKMIIPLRDDPENLSFDEEISYLFQFDSKIKIISCFSGIFLLLYSWQLRTLFGSSPLINGLDPNYTKGKQEEGMGADQLENQFP